jgi:hypothetical protein
MQELLNEFAEKVASFKDYTVKTTERESIARYLISRTSETSASALLMALRTLYGIESLFWESETIWLTLGKDKIEVQEDDRNKLQAALTLLHNPAFFWDNIVFQRTVQALNSQPFDPETLQECHPAHMAWAVYEATLIRGLDPEDPGVAEIDEDVQQYMAVCLKRAGFVYPPEQLLMVEDNLANMLSKEQLPFIETVKKTWSHVNKKVLRDRVFQEDPLDVQLMRLASVYEYVKERGKFMAADIVALEKGIMP